MRFRKENPPGIRPGDTLFFLSNGKPSPKAYVRGVHTPRRWCKLPTEEARPSWKCHEIMILGLE